MDKPAQVKRAMNKRFRKKLSLLTILTLSFGAAFLPFGISYAAAPIAQLSGGSVPGSGDTMTGSDTTDTQTLTSAQQLAQQQNQIQYLQNQVNALNGLQQSMTDLRGQNEVLTHQIEQLELALKLLTDRVVALEAANKVTQPPVALKSNSPSVNNVQPSEEQAYKAAYELINQNRYDDAISAFNQFLTQYPHSTHASSANYWLGELYMVKGQPDQATQEFRKVLVFKESPHMPDALRQLGVIYLANGDSAHAKQMFTRVVKEYPGTAAAGMAQKQLDGMK